MIRKRKISKRQLFAKTVEILQPILKLDSWQIKVVYNTKMSKAVLADCQVRPEYKMMNIRVNLEMLKQYNDYDVICTAIHEMVHSITWDLASWADQLCKGDKIKLEITRKYDESLVSAFERIIADLVADILKRRLEEDGYPELDLTFENLKKLYNKPPAPKTSQKKSNIN
jgi:hypothetical protein